MYWSTEPECTWNRAKDQEYCVFTSSEFANGRGISIHATWPQVGEIFSFPAFRDAEAHRNLGSNANQLPNPPFFIAEIPNHGMGVIANRTILRGEWLMSFTAAFMAPEGLHEQFNTTIRRQQQQIAFQALPSELRTTVESLAGQGGCNLYDDIMETNSFSFPIATEDETGEYHETSYRFLFPEIAVIIPKSTCRATETLTFAL